MNRGVDISMWIRLVPYIRNAKPGHWVRSIFTPPPIACALCLVLIISAGWSLRRTGIEHGQPSLVYHPDVAKQTLVASHVFRDSLNLRRLYTDDYRRTLYPYGTAVMMGRGARAYAAVTGRDDLNKVHRWVWALRMRFLASVLYLVAVVVTCLFLWRRFGLVTALLAAALLVAEPVIVQHSHYAMNDVPLVAFLLMAWSAAGMMQEERPTMPVFSLLTGLCLGLAIGTKYQAVLAVVFPVAAWTWSTRNKGPRWLLLSMTAVGGGSLAGIALTCPLLLKDPAYFISAFPEFMRWQANIMEMEIPLTTKLARNARALVGQFMPACHWLLLIGLAGAAWITTSSRTSSSQRAPTASALILCSILIVTLIAMRDFLRPNDLIPVLAFASVSLAVFLGILAQRAAASSRRWAVGALGLVAFCPLVAFLFTATRDSMALSRPDTRVLAQAWCIENLPPNARVVRERYTLSTGRHDATEYRCRSLCEAEIEHRIRAGRFDYVITSSQAHNRFSEQLSPFYSVQRQAIYNYLCTNHQCIATFSDRPLHFAHPTIRIYAKERVAQILTGL